MLENGPLVPSANGNDLAGSEPSPDRSFAAPDYLSPGAAATLLPPMFGAAIQFPDLDDTDGWKTMIAGMDAYVSALMEKAGFGGRQSVEAREINGIKLFIAKSDALTNDDRAVILDFHGGALIAGSGRIAR
ncbi:MAG: esterase/lipase/thioesterase [Bradyrhizobium sp.]|nr:esterase/lipase/thioesterase [Bradyrhizobium sp.]